MPPRDPHAILQMLGQTTLKVDTYFLQRTGFVANQTILKLGEYNLNCVPATLGVEESRFLAVLTPVEVNHFGRFKAGTHLLILTFDDPENNDVARYHLRVTLVDLVPVPDRKNVCFLLLKLKSLPTEFVLFLGAYLEGLAARKAAWDTLATAVTQAEACPPGSLEARATITGTLGQAAVTIVAFHTKKLELIWPDGPGQWGSNAGVHLKVSLRGHGIVLEGTVDAEGSFLPDFHSEWLDFVEDLKFHQTLKQQGRTVP